MTDLIINFHLRERKNIVLQEAPASGNVARMSYIIDLFSGALSPFWVEFPIAQWASGQFWHLYYTLWVLKMLPFCIKDDIFQN